MRFEPLLATDGERANLDRSWNARPADRLSVAATFCTHQADDWDAPDDVLPKDSELDDGGAMAMKPTGGMAELLAQPRYEVILLDGAEQAVFEHVPTEVTVTVTTSPRKGLEPTPFWSRRWPRTVTSSFRTRPRDSVRDTAHLTELVDRLRGIGATDVLRSRATPRSRRASSTVRLALRALAELGQPFQDVGITGYPESQAFIPGRRDDQGDVREGGVRRTSPPICFDAEVTAAWTGAGEIDEALIHIGLPGPVPLTKLFRVSARIGVGDSLRFLRTHKGWLGRAFSGAFDPTRLSKGSIRAWMPSGRTSPASVVFTFQRPRSDRCWRYKLERLPSLVPADADAYELITPATAYRR